MIGSYCCVESLDLEKHATDLYAAYATDHHNRIWTYLPHGPYPRLEDYRERVRTAYLGDDPLVHAIIDTRNGKPLGQASYMSIDPRVGVSRSVESSTRRPFSVQRRRQRPSIL